MSDWTDLQEAVKAMSKWVDNAEVNRDRNPEALTWHRVTKVAEEAGEAVGAMVIFSGGNPRKPYPGFTEAYENLVKELLDTALAALGAVEHLNANNGSSLSLLVDHAGRVVRRAGLRGES